MSESRAKKVRIKEVDGWTLRMLIDYIYTAEIQVTEENVQVRLRIFSATNEMNVQSHIFCHWGSALTWEISSVKWNFFRPCACKPSGHAV